MKTYIKYLMANPAKIAWIVAANLIMGGFSFFFFKEISDITRDSGILAVIGICIFITITRVVIDLQPYIEWKDGKDRN